MSRPRLLDDQITDEQLKIRKKNERAKQRRLERPNPFSNDQVNSIRTTNLIGIKDDYRLPDTQLHSESMGTHNNNSLSTHIFPSQGMVHEEGENKTSTTVKTRVEIEEKREIHEEKRSIEEQWSRVGIVIASPASLANVSVMSGLSAYLITQSHNFMGSWSTAIVSESIPFLAAAMIPCCASLMGRTALRGLVLASLIGLTMFFHSGISNDSVKNSDSYTRMVESRNTIVGQIKALTVSLENIPGNYATKRADLGGQIKDAQAALANSDTALASVKSEGSSSVAYEVWIRLGAMILNAYLVHMLVRRFL